MVMDIPPDVANFASNAGELLDFVGVLVIIGGLSVSTIVVIYRFLKGVHGNALYRLYRNSLARSILLGLEFLVAGDIIRTVAGNLDVNAVIVLAVIVIIRTLLGLEFQVEIDGRWPWQRANSKKA